MKSIYGFLFSRIGAVLLAGLPAFAQADGLALSDGQLLYLPIYSSIWHGDKRSEHGEPMKSQMSALVSIRNTSLKTPISLISARYYSTKGRLLKEYINSPRVIVPMETLELFVEKKEVEGGSGANFVIQWESARPTNPPVVEAVHIDNQAGRPYSFVTTARVMLQEK